MSLLDSILDGLRLESSVFCRMTLSGEWGFAKDALSGAPFHLILSGHAWLVKDGVDKGRRLEQGDLVVLPRGEPHRLLSGLDAQVIPFKQVVATQGLAPWTPGTRYKSVGLRFGSSAAATTLISGVFAFGEHRRNPLMAALPPVLHVRAASETPAARAVQAITTLLNAELLSGKPGANCVGARLADILFVQVVRDYLSTEELPQGWMRGMADREIAPVLALMHREPERSWSVETLARHVGMSRSRFAARFREAVGQGPLDYLTNWRMYQGAHHLGKGDMALTQVAAAVGYRSDASFSKAFKRWCGYSPAAYRRLPNVT